MYTLSKSDFKIASSCTKKLQYKKQRYPNNSDENDFLQILADGGHIVGKLATIIHEGTEITGETTVEALDQTRSLLQSDKITLHEAAIQAGQKLIRIDILKKEGNVFELIEVKAKSFNSEDDKSVEKKNMQDYIEDVVFQTLVLQEAYPDAVIHSFLLMPDKSKQTSIEGLASWFKILPESQQAERMPRFRKVNVQFIAEAGSEGYLQKRQLLIEDALLEMLPLDEKVKELGAVIQNRTLQLLRILNTDFKFEPGDYLINKNCKGCEFQPQDKQLKNGFDDCWGSMAEINPNIFELYHGGSIGHYKKGFYFDELISEKKFSLYDIDLERLKTSKEEYGSRGQRQLIQIEYTRRNEEWTSPHMAEELKQWKYPLHFIDFETYTGAIPYHKGMRPYETVAFQWSCHTIHKEGEAPVHTEWINTDQSFPNFHFAESVMTQLGYEGTPLMWATHENTTLRAILNQMENYGYKNDLLKDWLTDITTDKSREGRFVNMDAFTLHHYFHPYMKGRTSIKKTLPAVWNFHPFLYSIPWFKPYFKADDEGNTLNPYQTLKYIFAAGSYEQEIAEHEIEEVVKEGGAAMKAYNDMMYGDPASRESLKRQLLEYCKLDTMAMVIIWEYWRKECNK